MQRRRSDEQCLAHLGPGDDGPQARSQEDAILGQRRLDALRMSARRSQPRAESDQLVERQQRRAQHGEVRRFEVRSTLALHGSVRHRMLAYVSGRSESRNARSQPGSTLLAAASSASAIPAAPLSRPVSSICVPSNSARR